MNILKIAFDDKQLDKEKLQNVLDAIQTDHIFWENAEEFILFSREGEYTWLEQSGDTISLGGGVDLPGGVEVVDFDVWYEEAMKALGGKAVTWKVLKRNPRPRYRKRSRQKPTVAKTIVRVLYTTQQVYTFKNVRSVQIIDDKVYIQHERDITEGIKESSESEINGDLVMAVVIHEVGNRSNFFRNIDGTWDFQAEDGTVINSGKQLGRIFKK